MNRTPMLDLCDTDSLLHPAEIIRRLYEWADRFPSRDHAGAVVGLSGDNVSEILSGRRAPPAMVLRQIGVRKRRVWVFEDDEEASAKAA